MITQPRSACPINRGVELLGDHWSLVIVRDIAFQDFRGFRELLTNSMEGITAPMLSRRLHELVELGLLTKDDVPRGTQGRYSLTEQGIQLVPLLFELARVGSLLDPQTQTTMPELADLADTPQGVEKYMETLRRRHFDPPTDQAHASTSKRAVDSAASQ